MFEILRLTIISARPRQWLKNVSLFTGLVFVGWLFIAEKFFKVFYAVFIFSILASSVYIFNDVLDAPFDRLHPLKRKRPIASGQLPAPFAFVIAMTGFFVSLFLAFNLSFFFFATCVAYMLLHIFYTIFFKKIPILDVLSIASGFILRVYAGAIVIDAHIDVWLLLCVISFALFLAVGKRRCELTLLASKAGSHREVLFFYPEKLLDIYTSMFANTTWLTYALFTFIQPPKLPQKPILISLMADLPKAFITQKWLMATIPLVIYGVMRYLQIIYEKGEGDSPEKVLLSDKPLLATVIFWGIMIVFIIYGLG